jgi:hypothetical protein
MRIFKMDLETFELEFEPEVLLIKEFSDIIKRDKAKGKPLAMAELGYVWFFSDYKSDFVQIIDEDERSLAIIDALDGLPKNWKPDDYVLAAIDAYKTGSYTVTVRMLEDARSIVDNMSKWAKVAAANLDEMVETKFGERAKYDVSKVRAFIGDLPKMLITITTLEEKVLREKDGADTHRGSQEKAIFEDPEQ